MMRTHRKLLCAAAFFAAVAGLAGEPPLRITPREGVLLLKNGAVLPGRITAAGDHYYVLLPKGEIRLRAAEVEMQCNDLVDGYRRKRAKIEDGKATDHLGLAEWCVRHKLFECADKELAAAAAIDPEQPRLALIGKRLEQARREIKIPPMRAKPLDRGPTNDDLDRLVRGMPKGSVATFTSSIQPLLLNNCTTSGCHGPRSEGKLRLLRLSLAAAPSPRSTQRNLHSVWQCINAAEPMASPLLTAPIQQHGNTKAAIFTNREAVQYRQLLAWVQSVSRPRGPSQPSTVDQTTPPLLQTTPRGRPQERDDSLSSSDLAAADAPPHMDSAMPALDEPATDAAEAESQPPAAPYTPVDPFDPEIFNRRYFPRSTSRGRQ
ncbi:MAG TPA: hypothetical protein VMV69_02270 [Pirellulales bacterium]|nr:hypothetical protein [Pirellulales bacterium]